MSGFDDVVVAADGPPPSRLTLGFARAAPLLVVAGTTTELDPAFASQLLALFKAAVHEVTMRGGAIVTGGTDAGIFRVLRTAIDSSASAPRTVGVAPDSMLMATTGQSKAAPDRAPVDAGLDVLVRVSGDGWGQETAMLSQVVSVIAGDEPVAVLLVGGGTVTASEVREHVRQRRRIIAVTGSGRLVDELATGSHDDELRLLVEAGAITFVGVDGGPGALARAVRAALARRGGSRLGRRVGMSRRAAARRRRWAVLSVFPQVPFEPDAPAPLARGAAQRYPELAARCREANAVVFPAFAETEIRALIEQNRYRWFAVLAIAGGLLTTVAGAVQAWLDSAQWPGVLVATLGAATTSLSTIARRQGSREQYVTARRRAEDLRSLYFQHLVTPPTGGRDGDAGDDLGVRVARIKHGRQPA